MGINGPRVRSFPFTTLRPTHTEIMRCFTELSTVRIDTVVPVIDGDDAKTTTNPKGSRAAPDILVPDGSNDHQSGSTRQIRGVVASYSSVQRSCQCSQDSVGSGADPTLRGVIGWSVHTMWLSQTRP
ncbi:hypothetical protein BSLG_010054 [Batrachochytrium salamandrivorans]|nr:hypothetical protein BSLG_010054 [Batrachochytrium salamandrivorans]